MTMALNVDHLLRTAATLKLLPAYLLDVRTLAAPLQSVFDAVGC